MLIRMVYGIGMRLLISLLLVISLNGCDMTASRSVKTEIDGGILRSVGVIKSRKILDLNTLDANSSETSAEANIFGLEYLTADGGYRSSTAIRYDIELLDGGLLTVYSESWRYQVDDCVNIIIDIDNPKNQPQFFLNKTDC